MITLRDTSYNAVKEIRILSLLIVGNFARNMPIRGNLKIKKWCRELSKSKKQELKARVIDAPVENKH